MQVTEQNVWQEIAEVKDAVSAVLARAKALGASSAEASMSRTRGLSVETRHGEVETVEFNQDGGLGISLYFGQRKGSASTADLSPQALERAVAAAADIARYTSEDPHAGVAEAGWLEFSPPDLDLFYPDSISTELAISLCAGAEEAAFATDKRITNSEGASFSSHQGLKVYGNSHGQLVGYPSSRHSFSCVVIGEQDDEMQRDYSFTVARQYSKLLDPKQIGRESALETVARLGARQVPTQKVPVIFRADIASSLFGHLVSAISGGSIYRKSSFLLDKVGKQVMSSAVTVQEKPHLTQALASSPFDAEGVKTRDLAVIENGVLNTYLTTSYSARKLGMASTGHAGGIHNWLISHGNDDLAALCRQMGKGLLVTELMGQGVNTVTGDYSRGASGFWVEHGEIQFPVAEVTIAGNLADMFMNIAAVGNDVDRRGGVLTGSVLISQMQVAGA
ncbi:MULTISPECIES: metalloprotease PmbA [unclassified Arsukibacterium]|uniref:metalloprotease PmbA n=1 Tax=unclassified Arsukibacterium TaxID=2635278 RepID=UPI000C534B73|nr:MULTISPECIES: metalloprotease PmbA [unclassified Arsukibacterium]MAA95008.1 metalloprotease PmbA [Rheinheimera sp.]MBM35378.1 metalloprotease PmbA [Rheinheimera sp.]HAW94529.1 metalloprotease PmbA [Candidatus Azambacteria bacterium]|tara:strand:- start:5477 stop:6823 length:1347 start_codon:yes stop_codon:yes gene_type:complete